MHVPGPYQARAQMIYTKLRDNIIRNVYKVSKCLIDLLLQLLMLYD